MSFTLRLPVENFAGFRVFTQNFRSELAYSKGRRVANVWRVPIFQDRPATWADAQQVTFDQAFIAFLDLSPAGNRLLVSSDRSGNQDIWVFPAEGGEMKLLTTELTPDWSPSWAPDAKEIAFYSGRSGNRDIWVMSADGSSPRRLTGHEAGDYHPVWSPVPNSGR